MLLTPRTWSCLPILLFSAFSSTAPANAVDIRYVVYLTAQNNIVPDRSLVQEITHVSLAFMPSDAFNNATASAWPLFTTVEAVRSQFAPGTAVMVAIGGWGDIDGFARAALSDASRRLFARNVKAMLEATGADGIDVDWEYPGGNGPDYKQIPNSAKVWEIKAFPKLLSEIRLAIGSEKLMSAAVPGLTRDMLAFSKRTIPAISASVDFFSIMTYDLMNRRDNVTKHETGIELSTAAITAYQEIGVPVEKMNLGFGFFIKWFTTDPDGGCEGRTVGCRTVLMQDPQTGEDLGKAGAFSWHEGPPANLKDSFDRAMNDGGQFDLDGHYFWDREDQIFWSWDDPATIAIKFPAIMEKKNLSGVSAWGLGEDAYDFVHLKALTASVKTYSQQRRKKSLTGIESGDDTSDASTLVSKIHGLERNHECALFAGLALALIWALCVY
ncbi:hypothetical protein MMC13_000036 [Lambiella insularis]|nr:hypothetical protein [Lambiella insularis]